MKAEIIAMKKEGDAIILSIKCTPPSEFTLGPPPSLEAVRRAGKSPIALLKDTNDRVDKRDRGIREYKKRMRRYRLGFVELSGVEEE